MKQKITKIIIAALLMMLTFVAVDFDLSWAEAEIETENSSTSEVSKDIEKKMEFLYIENGEIECPGTQNIAVAWDKDMCNVTEFILVYSDSEGFTYELKESVRAEKSVLFTKEFSSEEVGTYKINGMKYFVVESEEEQFFDFESVEINAEFEVVDNQNASMIEVVEKNIVEPSTDTAGIASDVQALLEETSAKPRNNDRKKVVVVIDPGHGGDDPGTCHYGLKEKDINLKIGKYLRDELNQYSGVEVYMTRETDKHLETATASGITNRVNYAAGKNADLLVSIHINAVGGKGAEVWAPNENYRLDIYEEGQGVSQKILDELIALGLYNRGVKESYSKNNTQYEDGSLADYYGIIRQSKEAGFVGIIVEHAFLDNASDAAFLSKESNLKNLGIADATGIANYYGLKKGQWVIVDGAKKYQYTDGSYAVEKWINQKDGKFYVDIDGIVVTGVYNIDGVDYYFNSSGVMQTGWQKIDGIWYHFNSSGAMTKGWLKDSGSWYYLDNDGKMLTGLQEIGGAKYYLNSSGVMLTGWIRTNNTWYYFDNNGAATKGWLKQGNVWYYMDSDCKMITGTHTINGEQYYFDSSGAWVQGTSISGKSKTTVSQMIRYYNSSGAKYPSGVYESKGAPTLEDFCRIYYEEAEAEGIRAEVAFCQAMKETGWLKFGGDVKASQCNFAGIGAVGGGATGHTFDNVRQGIRGHIQHLKAYANKSSLVNVCVDPRFNLVTRGSAQYVEWLGQKANPSGKGWAPSATYGTEIVKMMNTLLSK